MLTEDSYLLSISRGVTYNTPAFYYYQGTLQYDEKGNLSEEYAQNEELEGFSKEEFLPEVYEIAQQIGAVMLYQ